MESEGKKVKSSGGLSGTGSKFDEAEAQAQYTTEKKKYHKAALGLQVIFISEDLLNHGPALFKS